MNKEKQEYKTSCFAYVEKNCQNCKFYKTEEYYEKYVKPLKNSSGGA